MGEAPSGREVSGEIFASHIRMSEYLGVTKEALFGPYQHFLNDPPDRLDWDDYAKLKEIAAGFAGSDERLIQLGAAVMETPKTALGSRALALVVDPAVLLLKASKNGWGRLFTNVDVLCSREKDRVRVELQLHPGYRPCRPFFVQNVGILENAPKLIGCDLAEVEWSTDGYRGTYLVRPPRSDTFWARAGRWVRVLRNTQVTVQELTDQQERLNRQNRELATALQKTQVALATRDRFLQTIDHELRTPLNGIQGGLKALSSGPLAQDQQRWLEAIDLSSARLNTIIQSVLEYSRLEAQSLQPRPRDFRPSRLMQALLQEASHLAPDTPLSVQCKAEGWLHADDERIVKVVTELLRNALTASAQAPVQLELQTRGTPVCSLEFTVSDQGPGIPLDAQARIFEPFVQLGKGEARAGQGSGIGLSIAQAVTRALGGSLTLSSSPGEGATFHASFPVHPAQPREDQPSRALSVLLVDDDRINRLVGRRLLKQLGCSVTLAEDGEEALQKYDPDTHGLVLMDCEMPNLDGWAATRELRKRGALTPVVAVTAYTAEADRERCYNSGMNDFIAKPLSEVALASALERWVAPPPVY